MKLTLIILAVTLTAQAQQPQLDDSETNARMARARTFLPKDQNAGTSAMLDGRNCPDGMVIGKADFVEDGSHGKVYACFPAKAVLIKCILDKVDYYDDYKADISGVLHQKHSAPYDECRYVYGHLQEAKTMEGMFKKMAEVGYNGPASVVFDDLSVGKNGMAVSCMMKSGVCDKNSLKSYAGEKGKAKPVAREVKKVYKETAQEKEIRDASDAVMAPVEDEKPIQPDPKPKTKDPDYDSQ